ncbi:winged helix-turn-helix domain-containing protein [Mesorhizobium opportunistum]|uniref:Winged helix-turn-helix domain-containing protein n=1 Tax=Mesorhizobium opportunistum TaxID=593909 RepID=A0ABV1YBG8_9HYPH|nr:winged helix-turn-helix domain-containing protein [Mesorhizobium sp.]TIN90725.1 MAG: hypothetical protein E5Y06_31295 [Mesorhizobium sp.]TJU97905.1 MAG: hypothetical protein E5Y08_16020 [Mesorhizobium sp.]TJV16272.1 MAG: hypothetical protein E5Y07_17825 [Mesorhizobium sp.]
MQRSEKLYTFAGFTLDLENGLLRSAVGEISLRPKSFDVLSYLVGNAGRVVPKGELLDAIWTDVTVTEDSLTQCIRDVRLALNDQAQDLIRTLPRRGYMFSGEATEQSDPLPALPVVASPTAPSIAILPFVNMSSDPEHDFFAAGLAEDIITRLSRLRWLFVSARNSSFTYKDNTVDAKQVGQELGVRYVLNGSVRRSGQRLRISTRLSDASTALQVWAERYDVEVADFFALQDQIAESVIAAIEPRIYTAEHQRFQSRPPDSLDAWGSVMKAMPYVWTWGSAEEIETAQSLLKRATDIDPDYARANSLLAWTHAARVQLGLADPIETMATARQMAQMAIRRDPEDPWTHFASGYVHMVAREFDPAVADLKEAIELNPSLAFAHMILGSTYGYGGMPEAGMRHLALAAKMSPRDFTQAANFATTGLCHLMARRFAEAVAWEWRAVELRPHFGTAWRTMAAAAGLAGDHDTAVHALSQARRLHPSLSVDWIERYHPIVQQHDRSMYIDGLRTAGLE